MIITVLILFTGCEENEPIVETSTEDLRRALTESEWSIELFFDGDNKTHLLKGVIFSFSEDGTVSAANSSAHGSWSVGDYGRGGSKLLLEFDPSTDARLLTNEWKTVEISLSFLRFEDSGGGPGEITQVNKLTLRKIQ